MGKYGLKKVGGTPSFRCFREEVTMITIRLVLFLLTINSVVVVVSGWLQTPSFNYRFALFITSISLGSSPVLAATVYEAPPVIDVPGQRGNGGIDAFSAAGSAMSIKKQSTLSDTEFKRVQRGELQPSREPRAVKRRVLKACSDNKITKTAKSDSKDCTRRVMAGELDFMLEAMDSTS
jgi:hypothetical protein